MRASGGLGIAHRPLDPERGIAHRCREFVGPQLRLAFGQDDRDPSCPFSLLKRRASIIS